MADPERSIKPIFSLAQWREVYVDIADPTDYKAALHLIGDWEHWRWLLKQSAGFAAAVHEWREEVATKIASEAISDLKVQAKKPTGIGAAKWLAENGWKEKQVGRPRKVAKPDESHQQQVHQDYTRIMSEAGRA